MQGLFDEYIAMNGAKPTHPADMLQTYPGGPYGYRLRRIILTNFWLYGQQEFEIPHGRLFLAGENASGKSTVLTAALPLAIDGDTRPHRLDTFGGRERHVDYYVLGSEESATPFSFEKRTSYIALEFEWCDPERPPIAQELRWYWENGERERTRFLTIGLSLAGNANNSNRIRRLFFLITDGSRLGYDLHTVETHDKQKRAYDHAKFKQQLEGHGIVCDTQDEYERLVSHYLFGFPEVKDFRSLMNFLLLLRRPNLNTELRFSQVHENLKQSLRKISSQTTGQAIDIIDQIDTIEDEIKRLQEEYQVAQQLHDEQQKLALARARVAACEYLERQLAQDKAQNQVTKLHNELRTAMHERQSAEAQRSELQAESNQIEGQIRALEASEGLQVAQKLIATRERVQEAQMQRDNQKQSLEATHRATEGIRQRLKQQETTFAKRKKALESQLRELQRIASEEALWETATLQLEMADSQISTISLEDARLDIPLAVTILTGAQSRERIAWLQQLEALHRNKERAATEVQNARNVEDIRSVELDESRRRFQNAQDSADELQQRLDVQIDQLVARSESLGIASFSRVDVADAGQAMTLEGRSPADQAVAQFAASIEAYRKTFEALDQELERTETDLRIELGQMERRRERQQERLAEMQAEYEQKLSEPESTPESPARWITARARLAERGIEAIPLYALIDFDPSIDSESEEAGRIECMLEDAGLLNALVVAPSQVEAADALLAAEDLSDCRLRVEELVSRGGRDVILRPSVAPPWDEQVPGEEIRLRQLLRFDEAVSQDIENGSKKWEEAITAVLTALWFPDGATPVLPLDTSNAGDHEGTLSGGQVSHPTLHHPRPYGLMNEDGSWQHGLLTGRAVGGNARFIGKATRLRARQREIDELNGQMVMLKSEVGQLQEQIAREEHRQRQMKDVQRQLRKTLTTSGMEKVQTTLVQTKETLDRAWERYQQARQKTQEAQQKYNAYVAQLEKECRGFDAFAGNAASVQEALRGMQTLSNKHSALQDQLSGINDVWEEHQRDRNALVEAETNEELVSKLYEEVRNIVLQVQAEFEELQRIAQLENVEDLNKRLGNLQARRKELATVLAHANELYIRADERVSSLESQRSGVESHLEEAQEVCEEQLADFMNLLVAYPVAQLAQARQVAKDGDYVGSAHRLLEGPIRENELQARKESLQEESNNVYNYLLQIYNKESHTLIEYGPNIDIQGHILFANDNQSSPVELLERLSEQIEVQKTLLDAQERKLFEDFLIQEIAEEIRTHIFEAETWVQRINKVLSNMPMVGERYSLEWKPLAEYDPTRPGSHLARHHKLLRKQSQTLTAEEMDTLMNAFRQEISLARLKRQEDPGMNFTETLELIFDYREWFHFVVFVTPPGSQRQQLTERVLRARSGAEQLFALYIPLFSALAALYANAAHGAPRLLALDEAFDKASLANTQHIMEFLTAQDFQWIMTGPQITGTGSPVPVSARYLMIHEKGSPVATASASFWYGSKLLQEE